MLKESVQDGPCLTHSYAMYHPWDVPQSAASPSPVLLTCQGCALDPNASALRASTTPARL